MIMIRNIINYIVFIPVALLTPGVNFAGPVVGGNTAEPTTLNNTALKADQMRTSTVLQTEQESEETDIALMASGRGMSAQEATDLYNFQKNFRELAADIIEKYPNQISRIYVDPHNPQGYLDFIGDIPARVEELAGKLNIHKKIVFGKAGEMSLDDKFSRVPIISKALGNRGYKNLAVYHSMEDDAVHVDLRIPDNANIPEKAQLLGSINASLRGSKAKEIPASKLVMNITRGEEPLVTMHTTRGGAYTHDSGACTSGWPVYRYSTNFGNDYVGYGMITAGHCTEGGLTGYIRDHVNGYDYALENWVHYFDQNGYDLAFHRTPTSYVGNEFHADTNNIRQALYFQYTNSMVGNGVCLFGRSSNYRSCTAYVQQVNVSVYVDGIYTNGLAVTSSTSSILGDSGGGWSSGNTAWGINTGTYGASGGLFTPIEVAMNILGVYIP